jgi:hemerythrin superfamily protein
MATKRPAKRAASARRLPLALQLLKDDHAAVDKLFRQFERSDDASARASLAQQICAALTRHATIEETLFYPEVRAAIEEQDLLDEAEVEHGSIKALVEQIGSSRPGDDLFEARVTVLKEYVKHHVKEEEDEMFPKVKRAGLDLEALGRQMQAELAQGAPSEGTRKSPSRARTAERRP